MIFEAVRAGKLTAVARRLNDAERGMFIRSGSVFVWTESDDDLGLRRWTDGLLWYANSVIVVAPWTYNNVITRSASRMREVSRHLI